MTPVARNGFRISNGGNGTLIASLRSGSPYVFVSNDGYLALSGLNFHSQHDLLSPDHARAIATALTEWADQQEASDA